MAIATSADPAGVDLLRTVLPMGAPPPKQLCACEITPPRGREVLIITQPDATATSIHVGFPIQVNRNTRDYWPLFIANTYFGAHGGHVGQLHQELEEERGYTDDAYSYIEYSGPPPAGPALASFPPPGTPRSEQYFSIAIGPVAHQYAHFVLKAVTAELQHFVQEGLTPAQVEQAKLEAGALSLQHVEDIDRELAYRLDDAFYGLGKHGYYTDLLKNISEVTADQVNAALRRNLQAGNLRYVITTSEAYGQKLANDLVSNSDCKAKTAAEYQIPSPVPTEKQALLDQDEQWIAYPLGIKPNNIHVVRSDQMFETAGIPGLGGPPAEGAGK